MSLGSLGNSFLVVRVVWVIHFLWSGVSTTRAQLQFNDATLQGYLHLCDCMQYAGYRHDETEESQVFNNNNDTDHNNNNNNDNNNMITINSSNNNSNIGNINNCHNN